MFPHTLRFKVGFYVAIALTLTMLLFTLFAIRQERDELQEAAVHHVTHISEVITKSMRFAMLQNQPDYVASAIQDIGRQDNISKVRLFSKEGRIIHSTYLPEVGQVVDRKADACIQCHQSEKPLTQVSKIERTRVYAAPDGQRLLGSMEVIRNEPSCYTASCHAHTSAQTVLGVLDIVYSLDELDNAMKTSAASIASAALAFALLASFLVSLFVHRLVYRPLQDLEAGAKRIATGNLDDAIPVRSGDEFGELSASFNAMTSALRKSQQELQEWGRTLEQKVEKRTRELRIAQAEASRGEKLASVGLLAAGIAHELNNPLTGILTFSVLLRKKMADGSPDAEDLDLVIQETRRCAAIIRRLLDFAREKKPEKKFADLNRIIEETVQIIERPAHLNDIGITLDFDPALPQAWVDADLVKQVVMNMLVNAQHAIEGKGGITIRTRRLPEPKSAEPGAPPVPMAEISIIDTGCGIPEQNLKRIFDPFFTSKEVGKGTGLGLSVSHGIIKAHGGAIEVQSRVGEGATFRVYLPLDPPPGEATITSSGSKQ